MNTRNLKVLAAIVAILFGAFLLLDSGNQNGSANEPWLPGLKDQLNDITEVVVDNGDSTLTIVKSDNAWQVVERDNYPADVAKLRDLLLALGEAEIVESKTSNPENYQQLGVEDPNPAPESNAVGITVRGDRIERTAIIGNSAQASFRFARESGAEQSVLINKNPTLPSGASGWMMRELVEIPAERIASVSIVHTDGEEIRLSKATQDETTFNVDNIPSGRELSYASVANGMGGVLATLEMEEVRKTPEQFSPNVTTTFTLFDGLAVTIDSVTDGESSWIDIRAEAAEDEAAAEADEINARVAGWQYQVVDYKANLLKRRFEDILKEEE